MTTEHYTDPAAFMRDAFGQRPAKRAAKAPDSEQALMTAIIDMLRLRGCVAVRVNSGAIPIEDERGRRLVRMAAAGTSDILACLPSGRFLACEVKRPGKKATPLQSAFLASVEQAGGLSIVACSLDDVIALLDKESK